MKTTDRMLTCPFCEAAPLAVRTHSIQIQHEGERLQVADMEYCTCPNCGADPLLSDQIKRNENRVADAKRR